MAFAVESLAEEEKTVATARTCARCGVRYDMLSDPLYPCRCHVGDLVTARGGGAPVVVWDCCGAERDGTGCTRCVHSETGLPPGDEVHPLPAAALARRYGVPPAGHTAVLRTAGDALARLRVVRWDGTTQTLELSDHAAGTWCNRVAANLDAGTWRDEDGDDAVGTAWCGRMERAATTACASSRSATRDASRLVYPCISGGPDPRVVEFNALLLLRRHPDDGVPNAMREHLASSGRSPELAAQLNKPRYDR